MNCYQCTSTVLKPIKLDSMLPARQCVKCNGVHLDLLNYRNWRENSSVSSITKSAAVAVDAQDNKKALVCQKCSKIMLKFKISVDHENFVDVCSHCDDAWLDSGEWELLNELDIQNKLTQIMTDPWQKNIKQQHFEALKEGQYMSQLGEDDFETVKSFAQWIKDHPKKEIIEKYIRTNG
ncbi:hypothetical protein [Marinicellulosiphila megalodicopiae]|uniref:hypothetical protein n=1 Tax=Marinicellulosiphila megalodicopiae TaxID=2724896 RepID=UPI003BAF6BDB